MEQKSGCLICGGDLEYLERPTTLCCLFCGEEMTGDVRCTEGHFICDRCHRLSAEDLIEQYCIRTDSRDPLEIALVLMQSPQVKMHGPEHHFLVPAALLAAYYTTTGEVEKKERQIRIARQRAELIKGGFCGSHGDCGAAVGTGIFVSLVTGATPLSELPWRLSNLMTARCLQILAMHGGPRCCKRNSILAILEAVHFARQHFDVALPVRDTVRCAFSDLNRECRREGCPFYPGRSTASGA